jgi:hypothetical protein
VSRLGFYLQPRALNRPLTIPWTTPKSRLPALCARTPTVAASMKGVSKMKKLIATAAAVALALSGVALASSGSDGGSGDGVTTARTTTGITEVSDVSGPCDEAEHRNDPRCTGAAANTTKASGRGHGRGKGNGRSGKGRGRGGQSGRG